MPLTNQELLNLNQALNQLGKMSGVRFAYAVAKNVARIKTELEALDVAFAPSEEYKKYDDLRVKLAEEHAKKDEDGKPVSKNNQYEIDDLDSFNAALELLRVEYKESCDARDQQVKEYLELLKGESKVELYKVFIDHVPAEITVEQMYAIQPIISELEIL